MLRSTSCFLLVSFALVGCPKGNPCGDLMRDPATESCVCPDGFTPRPELGICEGPDGSVIPYDAGPIVDAGVDAPDASDSGPDASDAGEDSGTDACTERTFFRDADGDGFGDSEVTELACVAPDGFVEDDTDCADDCETCFPGGTEICDGRDNDCDSVTDEGVLSAFYRDMDGDTFGDPTMSVQACEAPEGYVDNDDDCNDACAICRPGGIEVCEGSLDENCSMGVDEGCACTNGTMRACPGGTDTGACVAGTQTCTSGVWGACMGAVGPAAETCDGVDNDCDSVPDNGTAAASCGSVSRATGVGCSGGSCFVSSCATVYRDCDGMFANGCEAQLGTVGACLACGDVCGWDCEAAGCNDAATLAAGGGHTCVTRDAGDVVCWGRNSEGALGDGTEVPRVAPVRTGSLTDVVETTAGINHTCARTNAGGVFCWGFNSVGQLGDGTTMLERLSPVGVSVGSSVTAISAGRSHTCAVGVDGLVRCWGLNSSRQLGDGSTMNRNSPVQVAGLFGARDVAAGDAHTCALLSNGTVRCWGANTQGQLGDGSTDARTGVVNVSGLTDVVSLSAGSRFTCASRANGTAWCWGVNTYGQLGDGTTMRRTLPTQVSTLANVATISAGFSSLYGHVCAVTTTGEAWCWGDNRYGQVGDGTTMNTRLTPVRVLTDVSAVAVGGGDHTCAVLTDAGVRCWGHNTNGQLGNGSEMSAALPGAVIAP